MPRATKPKNEKNKKLAQSTDIEHKSLIEEGKDYLEGIKKTERKMRKRLTKIKVGTAVIRTTYVSEWEQYAKTNRQTFTVL